MDRWAFQLVFHISTEIQQLLEIIQILYMFQSFHFLNLVIENSSNFKIISPLKIVL